ncbi:hypothetical protein N9954_05285 [Maribacter sp.]|nr:hypothetical protein [Maribacter sp.]
MTRLKTHKGFCITGSVLLLIMALFHGSGFSYVGEKIKQSNAEEFLKDIVPVLFAHPSIHLIALASFGILALFIGHESWKMLFLLSIIIVVDAFLAILLGGLIPGLLLFAAAICFILPAYGLMRNKTDQRQNA